MLGVIARGANGGVYRAMDTTLGWEVAVKALDARFGPQSATGRQFIEAARIMGRLQHPSIPAVHDMGEFPDGRPFFIMQLIRGRTLQDVLDEGAEPHRLLAVFEPACQAVAYAHCNGIVHGAFRPEHIMIGAFGEVQVLGWGAARVLGSSAPQADGVLADCHTDVLDLGSMLRVLLAGRDSAEPGLMALAKQCLSPSPADRPADGCAVASRIAELAMERGPSAGAVGLVDL